MLLPILLLLRAPSVGSASPVSPSDLASPSLAAAAPGDNDGDGIPDSVDPDDDNDGVLDSADTDPFHAAPPPGETPDIIAPGQDTDHDGIENVMDPDDDNDAVEDDEDPAPFTPVPPAEEPQAPVEEHPAPSRPDPPVVEQPVTDEPDTGQVVPSSLRGPSLSEPVQVTSPEQPKETAPLVVALPSTGNAAADSSPHLLAVALRVLALALGAAGMALRRRANRAQPPA